MVQAAVEAQLFGRRDRPVTVGRYTVLAPIGSGGMGSVFRAHDPELDREVALKLVRAERMGDATTRARLVQEARAMAKLGHPNVAMVFEVGEADGHLFVAMELVDGVDLRAWLGSQPRPWPQVLERFEQAGRGLVAAHAKGLIHRDFKPDNVVVDGEGRARVVDFGLAREQGSTALDTEEAGEAGEAAASEGEAPAGERRAPGEASEGALTTTGTLLGTPAYMSPEQWRGEAIDARSDQFSFCVSLWEGLFGARPFPQEALGSLMQAVTEGRIAEPRNGKVPGHVVRALRRGLRSDPAERFDDMDGLLAALRPARRARWLLAGTMAVAVVGAATLGPWLGDRDPDAACRDEGQRLAGVWDEPRREAAGAGLRATGLAYAEPTWRSVSTQLDRYAEEWIAQAEASCTGSPSEAAATRRARRQRCLEDARLALDHLADALVHADEAIAVDAAHAATRLPDLGACADDRRLARWAADPRPEHAAAEERARAALAKAPDAKVILRQLPLSFHRDAMLAHQAALEALKQKGNEGFWALVDLMLNNQQKLGRADLSRYAGEVGLDVAAFDAALDGKTHEARVKADVDLATSVGINGTPIMVRDKQILRGTQPERSLVELLTGTGSP